MSGRIDLEECEGQGSQGGHGFWACCVPMLVVFALIALKVTE